MINKKKNKIFLSVSTLAILIAMVKLFSFYTADDTEHEQSFQSNYRIFSLNIPSDLNFAGEKVPIENFDVREKIDRELLVNTYWQSQSLLFIKRANRWFPTIEKILKKNGVPDDFKYLALIESGLMNVVSPAGATGFWQILDETGKDYGLEINKEIDERYHVEKSTEFACEYLKNAYQNFGSWTLAAASYNMGVNGLKKQIKRQKIKNYYDLLLNEETGRYVYRIIAAKEILSNPEKYGFKVRAKDKYPHIATTTFVLDTAVSNFADFALEQGIDYKTLKIFNPWLRDSYLTNKNRKEYTLKIPTDTSLVKIYKQNYTDDSLLFSLDSTYTLPSDTISSIKSAQKPIK